MQLDHVERHRIQRFLQQIIFGIHEQTNPDHPRSGRPGKVSRQRQFQAARRWRKENKTDIGRTAINRRADRGHIIQATDFRVRAHAVFSSSATFRAAAAGSSAAVIGRPMTI